MLTRDQITVASRVMLPAYTLLCAIFGLVFVTDPGGRLGRAPSLEVARALLPIAAWGGLWLLLAAVMAAAWWRHDRDRFTAALAVCGLSWAAWGVVVEAAVLANDQVSYLAGALPWFVTVACVASLRSLRAGETR